MSAQADGFPEPKTNHQEFYSDELLGPRRVPRNPLDGITRVLRVYSAPSLVAVPQNHITFSTNFLFGSFCNNIEYLYKHDFPGLSTWVSLHWPVGSVDAGATELFPGALGFLTVNYLRGDGIF